MKRELSNDNVGPELESCFKSSKLLRAPDVEINEINPFLRSAPLDYSSFVYHDANEGIGDNSGYSEASELHYEFREMFSNMLDMPQLSSDYLSSGIEGVTSAAISYDMAALVSTNHVFYDFQCNPLHCVDEDGNSHSNQIQGIVACEESSCESCQSCITTDSVSEDVTSLSFEAFDNSTVCTDDFTMFYNEYVQLNSVLNAVGRCIAHPVQENYCDVCSAQDEAASLPSCVQIDNAEVSEWLNCHLTEEDMPFLSDDVVPSACLSSIVKPEELRKSITLVLDLDETLVHSVLYNCHDPDFSFPLVFDTMELTAYVKRRPYLQIFLEAVAEVFRVVVFTASRSVYADKLLDILDPERKLFSQRLYRESCTFSDGGYTKDLTILGVDLAKVAIIDNTPQVFQFQVNNGIPIKSWYDDPDDQELLELLPFLGILAGADDVRPVIAEKFGNCGH